MDSGRAILLSAWLLGGVAVGIVPAVARAQDREPLQWSIAPYLRGANTAVDLSCRGRIVGSDDSGFVDLTYLEISDRDRPQFVTIDSSSTQAYLDAAIAFWPGGVGSNARTRATPMPCSGSVTGGTCRGAGASWRTALGALAAPRYLAAARPFRLHGRAARHEQDPVRLPVQGSRFRGQRPRARLRVRRSAGGVQFPLLRTTPVAPGRCTGGWRIASR